MSILKKLCGICGIPNNEYQKTLSSVPTRSIPPLADILTRLKIDFSTSYHLDAASRITEIKRGDWVKDVQKGPQDSKLTSTLNVAGLVSSACWLFTKEAYGFFRKEAQHAIDSKNGLQAELDLLKADFPESVDYMGELVDYITTLLLKPTSEKLGWIIGNKTQDYLANIIKANLISIYRNLSKESTYSGENPLKHIQSALINLFKPFENEYYLHGLKIKNAQLVIKTLESQIELFKSETLWLDQGEALKKESLPILTRQELINQLASASKEKVIKLSEIENNRMEELEKKLNHVKTSKRLTSAEKEKALQKIRDAIFLQGYKIEAVGAFISNDIDKLNEFKAQSELMATKLKILSLLQANENPVGEVASELAILESNLEEAKKQLESLVEMRKNFMHQQVIPHCLKALFPEGEKNLLFFNYSQSNTQNLAWSLIPRLTPYLAELVPLLALADVSKQTDLLKQNPYAFDIRNGVEALTHDIFPVVFNKIQMSESLQGDLKELLTSYVDYLGIKIVNHLSQLDRTNFMSVIDLLTNLKQPASLTKEQLADPVTAIKEKMQEGFPDATFFEIEAAFGIRMQQLGLPFENDPEKTMVVLREELRDFCRNEHHKTSKKVVSDILRLLQLDNLESVGLPPFLARIAEEKGSVILAELFAKYLLPVVSGFEQMDFVQLEGDSIAGTALKVSTLKAAIPAILHYQIDNKLDVTVKTKKNGYADTVNDATKAIGEKLLKRADGDFPALHNFFIHLFSQNDVNQLLENAFKLTSSDDTVVNASEANIAHLAKSQLIDGVTPLLFNSIVKALTPILEKEKNGGAVFNQTLLLKVLPVLTVHLKDLNAGITALKTDADKKAFFENSSKELLDFFLPNQQESLQEAFPYFALDRIDEKGELKSKGPANEIATSLENLSGLFDSAKTFIFNKSFAKDVLIELYRACIENFKAPIKSPSSPIHLTAGEIALQKQMQNQMKDLIIQAARLTNLPFGLFFKIASFIPGVSILTDIAMEAICKSVQKELHGKVIAESLEKALHNQINKPKPKHADHDAELIKLEKELVRSLLSYIYKTICAKTDELLSVLDVPVIKQIKNAWLGIARWLFKTSMKLLGVTYVASFISYYILHSNRVNFVEAFAKPNKHEDVAIDMVKAGVDVLKQPWPATV